MRLAPKMLLAALVAVVSPELAHAASDLVVTDPVSRATPAGAPTGIGYMTIANTGAVADRLVSASSPLADHVEIHEMSVAKGIMTMHPVPGGLAVPAHGSVTLKPGSYHLMLIGPKQPFKAGDTIPVTLTFEHAGSERVDLAVKPMGEVTPPMSK